MDDPIGFGIGLDKSSIQSVSEVTPEAAATSITPVDTVSQSEMAAIIALLAAWNPILIPPSDSPSKVDLVASTAGNAILQYGKDEQDVISSSWEAYLAMINQLQQKYEESRKEHDRVDATQQPDLLSKLDAAANGVKQWVVDPSQTIPDGTNIALSSAFLASMMVSNVDTLMASAGQAAVQDIGSSNPIIDSLNTPGTAALDHDSAFAAELVASLYYSAFIQQTTLQMVQQAQAGAKPGNDSDFAVKFANNVLAIATVKISGDDANGNKVDKGRNDYVRVQLYTMALNLIYRTQFGGMSGQELLGLVQSPTVKAPEGIDPKSPEWIATLNLINALKTILPGMSPEVLQKMMDYVDEKHSAESMRESYNLLIGDLAAAPKVDAQRSIHARG